MSIKHSYTLVSCTKLVPLVCYEVIQLFELILGNLLRLLLLLKLHYEPGPLLILHCVVAKLKLRIKHTKIIIYRAAKRDYPWSRFP